jgi:hypothetical protein
MPTLSIRRLSAEDAMAFFALRLRCMDDAELQFRSLRVDVEREGLALWARRRAIDSRGAGG